MTETLASANLARFVADLRTVPVFGDLSKEDLEWLASRMEEKIAPAGGILARVGDPIEHLSVLLEGEIHFEKPGTVGTPMLIITAVQVTGLLPFSRLTEYRSNARAAQPVRSLLLHKRHFADLLNRMPKLGQRLVGLMSDRIRETTRMENQQDKLMALGKLSAGLAHELNNPAAAARRAAQNLTEAMESVRASSLKLLQHPFSEAQRDAALQFEQEAIKHAGSPALPSNDPLEFSDREEAVTSWLEAHRVPEPYKIASVLADACVDARKLDTLAATVGEEIVVHAVRRVACLITVYGLVHEIENSTRRISDLVSAVKRYSYMDQAPLQEVDLREDLENTLKIFNHRLKTGVVVVREYDPQLPRVCAFAGELNQVWTNLIDNAIDAMDGKGELHISTARELDCAAIEIRDNGPGIPQEIQSRVFDPFFTTKEVGQGTGLGLDTVMRIVLKHHGSIELKSQPGDTRFRVRIPFKQPSAQSSELEAKEK
jgi:signal transduction histidine kinase